MPIDWNAAVAQAEQHEREQQKQRDEQARLWREQYLADRERIEREQPKAIELALRLLKTAPAERQQEIKDAAEVADLTTLRNLEASARFNWR
jgi:hypothetical protein